MSPLFALRLLANRQLPRIHYENTQAKTYLFGHWEDFFGNDLSGTQRFCAQYQPREI